MFIEETEETKGFRIEIGHPFLVDPRSHDLSIDLLLKEKVDVSMNISIRTKCNTLILLSLDFSRCLTNVYASCFYRFLLAISGIIFYPM